ncbi:hypothetical protein [Flavobacterium gelatinilyticum]|uniref:hypothetical protein n=1 Tax=Flavobacterium gelatinilyticum TaxID=3003260 RepID=UPI00247FE48E|nr:hypothetical protein [Flavobacterium gelatinilyticum]
MKKIIFSIITLAALSLTSCSNDDQSSDVQGTAAAKEETVNASTKKAAALCTVTTTSVTVTKTAEPSSTYTNWTPAAATIGGVNVQWEGIYGGSIRPVNNTDRWYVGTIALTQVCAGWDDWNANILVKNASAANIGTAPTDPYNVLGYNGTISGSNYGLGYYAYNITTHVMTPSRAIVIWKTTQGTNSQSNTSPSTATEAYLVKVTGITPGTSNSVINYNWTQVK